jgi:hypothetical protein
MDSFLLRRTAQPRARGASGLKHLIVVLLSIATSLGAAAQTSGASAQAIDTRMSSERVKADPAGQYVLIKTVAASLTPPATQRTPRDDPEGYDIAGCWAPEQVLADWAPRADLSGRLIVLALETAAWTRDLARGGYPAAPLGEAIGRYEAAVVAAGATDAARNRGLETFAAELETLRRTAPGAVKTTKAGGCTRPSLAVQLRYKTVPAEGRARFIPKALHELCRAQGLDPADPTRCDYWMESSEGEPRFFIGEQVWQVRWPDGTTVRGEFDARSVSEPGVLTLKQKK